MKNLLTLFGLILWVSCTSNSYDLIIINADVYDGLGNPPAKVDIAISDGEIIEIGDLGEAKSEKIIDAKGMALSPGFIDMHTHLEPLMDMPLAESHVRQGVTFALGGPDGGGPWPFESYLDSLDQMELGLNVGYLIGHNSVRRAVLGLDDREPNLQELEEMKASIESAMKAGAFGISTGLKYLPGAFSKLDEIISLSKVASQNGGIYTSHLREEGVGLIPAVKEAIVISEQADIPVVLTHHKAIGVRMWGASSQTLALVDSARAQGLDIMMDQYPYAASHTGISVLIPAWAREGGKFSERVSDPVLKDSIKAGIIWNILNDRGGSDLRRIQFSRVSWRTELEGKTLHDWLTMEGEEPSVENGAEYVIKAQLNGGTGTIYHAMDEMDVEKIMAHPMTMIGSDGRLSEPGNGHPHPRAYGTFPRILGYYVREKGVLSLEEAIHKMTGMPAQRLGLANRGIIKKGMKADLVIFDPQTVIDKSTFVKPHQYPVGIEYVIIDGVLALEKGQFLGRTPGRLIRKTELTER
ncbi:N-acyl-D-amino-acid deacylase family protein [Algoriphagus sediminis]|uniref:D-aminoacylase n=1 Tax=Algoriphagus sediminis TaxID=3057113 RepID=A0ABT7Y8P3_9BACT|nr:D-aminoacylase [Algoriphagus sediminis]MDN3202841.1 D-aminoacylase [Algoriphagus sediminis]